MTRWLLPALAAFGGGGAVALHSIFLAPRGLKLNRRDVVLPRLPRAFDGYEILHLSDLHLGSLASGAEQVLVAAGLKADLVVVTGDMVEDVRYADACGRLLMATKNRDGIICIPGNHDNKAIRRAQGSNELWTALRKHGILTLVNEAFGLEQDGERLWIVGVDDPHDGTPDVLKAFADVPSGEAAVLLAHSPDIASLLPPGLADLVMTGHCHGGQVRTPWGPVFTRTRRHFPDVLGLQVIDGTPYQMSGGLGSSIPLRFLCPPEATLLRLVAPGLHVAPVYRAGAAASAASIV
jgi:predicted MPP superfamily phosphohydrolase